MSSNSEINAQNAQLSTGPRTKEGKKRSSLNALRHGLTSQIVVLPGEDVGAYKAMTSEFHREFTPQGFFETKLVQTIADVQWRLDRCQAIENNLFAITSARNEQDGVIWQFHSTAVAEINKSEPEDRNKWMDHAPGVASGLDVAKAFQTYANDLRILGAHERHLERYFQSTLKTLRETQEARKKSDHEKMKNAAALQQAAKSKGITYDPAADGFVFSVKDIENFIACQKRVKEVDNR